MRTDRELAQKILDVMFECLSRVHRRDHIPEDREECMDWARRQLSLCGVDVRPLGLSHAVLDTSMEDGIEDALYFMFSDFEMRHSGQSERMERVKRFLKITGLKIVKK